MSTDRPVPPPHMNLDYRVCSVISGSNQEGELSNPSKMNLADSHTTVNHKQEFVGRREILSTTPKL